MFSNKTASAIVVLAITVAAYGDDASVATAAAAHGAHDAVVSFEAVEQCLASADAVRPENPDSSKPVPTTGYCVDGDGGNNPYVASYLIDAFGTQWQDYCYNSTRLLEAVCGAGGGKLNISHTCTCVSEWIYVPGWGNRYAGKCQ